MDTETDVETTHAKGMDVLLAENGFNLRPRFVSYDRTGWIFINQPDGKVFEFSSSDLQAYLSREKPIDDPNYAELQLWFRSLYPEVISVLKEGSSIAKEIVERFDKKKDSSDLIEKLFEISEKLHEDRYVNADVGYAFDESDPKRIALVRSIIGR